MTAIMLLFYFTQLASASAMPARRRETSFRLAPWRKPRSRPRRNRTREPFG